FPGSPEDRPENVCQRCRGRLTECLKLSNPQEPEGKHCCSRSSSSSSSSRQQQQPIDRALRIETGVAEDRFKRRQQQWRRPTAARVLANKNDSQRQPAATEAGGGGQVKAKAEIMTRSYGSIRLLIELSLVLQRQTLPRMTKADAKSRIYNCRSAKSAERYFIALEWSSCLESLSSSYTHQFGFSKRHELGGVSQSSGP
uniref:Kinesin motor domain-containing protein n=1 Tax=Macrostomum lignano TaxID=282301 RepID=A0A1I8FE01_9PLAT